MRYFKGSGFRLARLPFGLRLVLTLYLLTTLLGFWAASLKYFERGLLGPEGIQDYYLGVEDPLLGSTEKSFGFLVDVTHPHLFTIPLVLLVLCHLVQLCQWPQSLKNLLYVTAFSGMALTLAVPWILGFAPWAAILVSAGGCVLLASGSVLCLLPLRDLWRRPKAERQG